jgi:hypothetical protein
VFLLFCWRIVWTGSWMDAAGSRYVLLVANMDMVVACLLPICCLGILPPNSGAEYILWDFPSVFPSCTSKNWGAKTFRAQTSVSARQYVSSGPVSRRGSKSSRRLQCKTIISQEGRHWYCHARKDLRGRKHNLEPSKSFRSMSVF